MSRCLKKTAGKAITSVAVEPAASPLLTQTRNGEPLKPAGRKIQGMGANVVPEVLDRSPAALRWAHKPENAGKTIVVVLPDSGERCLSSALFEGLFDAAGNPRA